MATVLSARARGGARVAALGHFGSLRSLGARGPSGHPRRVRPGRSLRSGAVAAVRARSILGTVGRILLGVVAAVAVAGAALVVLAYYGDVTFDIEAVVIAVVAAGILVYLWVRWR